MRLASCVEALRVAQLIDDTLQAHGSRDILGCGDVSLAKLRRQYFSNSLAITIVDDPDQTIGVLNSVGIGDARPLIEQQSFIPSGIVVGG